MPFRPLFTASFSRRLARATRHRPRSFHSSSSILAVTQSIQAREISKGPAATALSALLSRLSLPPDERLHPALLACLTHPSFASSQASSSASTSSPSSSATKPSNSDQSIPQQPIIETNEVLSSLGNSLLGLFASEHLSNLFPHLPTNALKQAVTACVGPTACFSVARELGLGTLNIKATPPRSQLKQEALNTGILVRWKREEVLSTDEIVKAIAGEIPVARRFKKYMKDGEVDEHRRHEKRDTYEDVISGAVKAMVGLIYQEKGIHAARQFTHAHFLTRHLDMPSLFNFKNPKHVLSSVVAGFMADKGIEPSSGMAKVESRLLASTGTSSQAPLFNIGLFLPSGLKLSEGFGSSLKMAEHRAAVNALLSIFLVRNTSDTEDLDLKGGRSELPSSLHAAWPLEAGVLSKMQDGERKGFSGVRGVVGGRELVGSRH